MIAATLIALSQPATMPLDLEDQRPYADLLCEYTAWDCAKAYRVMLCESSGNPRAYADGNYGLMQINAVHGPRVGGNLAALYDPEVNIAIAYQLYLERGWQPWAICGRR
jgi:hypothetical protein